MKTAIICLNLLFLSNILAAQTLDLTDQSLHIDFEDLYTKKQLAPYYEDKELFDYLNQLDFEVLQQQLNNDPSIELIRLDRYTDIESYGLWIYLLDKDANSVFYQQKGNYQKKLQQLVPKQESKYLVTAMSMFDSIEKKGEVDALWGALLSTAVTVEQRKRFAQHWLTAAQNSKSKRDLKDIETIISYDLGTFFVQKGLKNEALPYYEKWFELRKKQGGHLASAYLKLSALYTDLGKHQKSYELWQEYDAIYTKSGEKDENGWHAAKFRTALNNLARYHDADKAIEVFEQNYLKPKKVYTENGGIWSHTVPYTWAVQNSEKTEEQIKYLKLWAAAIQKYTDKNPLVQANSAIELLAHHNQYSQVNEELQKIRIKYFEELYLNNSLKAKPTYKGGFYAHRVLQSWSLVVPYEPMINLLIANERQTEVAQWYKKWLEAAIQTNNEEIIRATCITVFERLGKEKNTGLAEELFIQYYCKRLMTENNTKWELYGEWVYRWMPEKAAAVQAQKWIELTQKHGSAQLLAWVLDYAGAYYYFHANEPEQNLRCMQQKLALVKTHQQIELIDQTYTSLTWLTRELNQYPLALKYTIEDYLFDKKHGLKAKYSRLSLFHAIVSGCLTKSEITMKDKKDMKKQLKKLQKQLKKEPTEHAELLNWMDENLAYFDF